MPLIAAEPMRVTTSPERRPALAAGPLLDTLWMSAPAVPVPRSDVLTPR